MSGQRPSVGRVAHYVAHGTPIRADGNLAQADIEGWDAEYHHVVGLCVVNPTGLFFRSIADGGSSYDPNGAAGTWHWPKTV